MQPGVGGDRAGPPGAGGPLQGREGAARLGHDRHERGDVVLLDAELGDELEARPLTVGLQVFSSSDQGVDWAVICAATLMTSAPLLIGFLLFQRQFVQSFMRAGIR